MKPRLKSQIDDLYKLPLDEFTSARNALARTLSGSDKKEVAALVKPSLPIWVINQLYWNDGSTYEALIDASEKLRAVHRSALAGRDVDTRKPDELHKTTVEKAFAKALADAQKRGIHLTDAARDQLRRTLSALPTDEPAGRMTREPPPAGFSLLTGIKPRPPGQEKPARASQPAKPLSAEALRRQKAAEKQAEQVRKAAERNARRAEEKARKEQERRDREIKKAEAALKAAEQRLAELKR